MSTNSTDLSVRRGALLQNFAEMRIDAFLVTALPNVRYLAGFTGSNAALLITDDRAILFTDPRYQTQVAQESDCEVRIVKGPLSTEISGSIRRMHLKKVGFEQNRIGFAEHLQLIHALPKVRFKPVMDAVEKLRQVKSDSEIATIRASVQLNSAALEEALKNFKPAMTEVDLAAEIEYRMRLLGADGTAFETIVASGERSALPHAHPGERSIQANQLLLIDMGARVAGYCSDMTRTHAVGKLAPKARRMYRAVLESQLAAIDAVKPGATCTGVDRAARDVLREYGLEQAFIHSTGHGLGLEIHEGPRVGRKDKTKLEPGMVITIEPGVYLEHAGGVRIEDTVVVTANGCDILTPTSKELVVL
ncbi:MAG TPA: Xaa-Pro peptidase family protein [Bryobacteraceae bacterium]|jgi:Xaa-Pro aminopeptidase|nr:Xaa-Pro peptidase family protein [Bryobacteraceae bacterium]